MKPMFNSLTDVACSRAAVYNLALIINLGTWLAFWLSQEISKTSTTADLFWSSLVLLSLQWTQVTQPNTLKSPLSRVNKNSSFGFDLIVHGPTYNQTS